MLIRNYRSSRDLFLKIKESKKIIPLSGKKLETRNSPSLTSQWKPDLIQPSPPKTKLDKAKEELEELL